MAKPCTVVHVKVIYVKVKLRGLFSTTIHSPMPPHCCILYTGFLWLPALDYEHWCLFQKTKTNRYAPICITYLLSNTHPPTFWHGTDGSTNPRKVQVRPVSRLFFAVTPKWWYNLPLTFQTITDLDQEDLPVQQPSSWIRI